VPFLHHLLGATSHHDRQKQISLSLLTHWTRDGRANLPAAVCEGYQALEVQTSIEDFMPWGKAEALAHQLCYLAVGDSDKSTLGSFQERLLARCTAAGLVADHAGFESLPNRDLLSQLPVCGRTPDVTISWGSKCCYCIPQMGYDWFAISDIGTMSEAAMASFLEARPVIREIQQRSIFGLLSGYWMSTPGWPARRPWPPWGRSTSASGSLAAPCA
jgi:hypothetical protein